jgi:hypothetical protein
MLQLLTSFFKFLRDRPNAAFDKEMNRRTAESEALTNDLNLVARIHSRPGKAVFEYSPADLSGLTSKTALLAFLQPANYFRKRKGVRIARAASYDPVSRVVVTYMKTHRSKKAAAAAFAWGVFASDIPCIVRALEFAAATCGQPGRTSVFAWAPYNDLYNRLSLRNAIWVPTECTGVDSMPLPAGVTSGGTDGHRLYLLDSGGVRVVDLSRGIVAIDTRARDIPLGRECAASGMAICQNWALVAGPAFFGVYSLPAFERAPIARRNRVKSPMWPFASDGYFIYSLKVKKRRVDVFAITKTPDIVYQRSVVLNCPSHFIDDGFCCCCSGCVFTICVPKGQEQGRMVYAWGSFSMIDGSLINECSVRLSWPINGLFIDPWNRVVWEISNSTKGVSLIMLPIYCSHPPGLGGFDVANVSKGDFDGIKTTK